LGYPHDFVFSGRRLAGAKQAKTGHFRVVLSPDCRFASWRSGGASLRHFAVTRVEVKGNAPADHHGAGIVSAARQFSAAQTRSNNSPWMLENS
jgi:hypothetical protein